MHTNIDKCLAHLEALSNERLHQTNQKLRSDLGDTEWKLAISLWVSEQRDLYRELEYSTVTEYAQEELALSPAKTHDLLRAARALLELPLFSEAFRRGRLCWSKVRALKRVITPETEKVWVDYALTHNSHEVERKIVQSPSSWKRQKALNASLEGKPKVSHEQVQLLLEEPVPVRAKSKALAPTVQATLNTEPAAELKSETESKLPPPKFVRLTIDLTNDQWAIYEAMESRVWAKRGRKVSRAEVLMELCKQGLDQGSSRSRARYQVIIHANESGQAWYETDRGALPVSPEVLEEALKGRPPIREAELKTAADSKTNEASTSTCTSATEKTAPPDETRTSTCNSTTENTAPPDETPTSTCNSTTEKTAPPDEPPTSTTEHCLLPSCLANARPDIPVARIRAVCARAGNRCERCGTRSGNLQIHHKKPISEGGGNEEYNLELLCGPCHGLTHEPDFESRPDWVRARARRSKSRRSSLPRHPQDRMEPEEIP